MVQDFNTPSDQLGDYHDAKAISVEGLIYNIKFEEVFIVSLSYSIKFLPLAHQIFITKKKEGSHLNLYDENYNASLN